MTVVVGKTIYLQRSSSVLADKTQGNNICIILHLAVQLITGSELGNNFIVYSVVFLNSTVLASSWLSSVWITSKCRFRVEYFADANLILTVN